MIKKRTIKFRAFDLLDKRFIYPINDKYCGNFVISLNGQFVNFQNGSGGDEYIIQQYIGLIDKNFKNIYEGDIFKISNKQSLFYVEWNDYTAMFLYYPIERLKNLKVNLYSKGLSFNFLAVENFEVIGNILENPELIG